jgi:hypothetical protein
MSSTDVAVRDDVEGVADPGVPVAYDDAYTGVELDVTGGLFWYQDPLNPMSDVEPKGGYVGPEGADPITHQRLEIDPETGQRRVAGQDQRAQDTTPEDEAADV